MATATASGFSSSLSGLPDQVLLAHTRSLVLHEQALQLAVLDHLREIHARHLHLRRGFSSLFDYAIIALIYKYDNSLLITPVSRYCSRNPLVVSDHPLTSFGLAPRRERSRSS